MDHNSKERKGQNTLDTITRGISFHMNPKVPWILVGDKDFEMLRSKDLKKRIPHAGSKKGNWKKIILKSNRE